MSEGGPGRYDRFFTMSLDMLCIASAEGYFIELNPAWTRTLGWSPDELKAEPFLSFVHPDDQEATIAETLKLQAGVDTVRFENRYRCRDGSYRALRWTSSFLPETQRYYAVAHDVTAERATDERIQRANQELSAFITTLEERNTQITLLNELGDLLQSCASLDEGSEVIRHYAGRLFPHDTAGAVSVISNSRNTVDVVATWGETKLGEDVFGPDQCWALRRGRAHSVTATTGVPCRHVGELSDPYMCVPMMAQGEAIGLLTVTLGAPAAGDGHGTSPEELTVSVAEHVGLALANFKLRETLRSQSIRDPLTSLFNRRFMQESLEREIRRAARAKRFVSVLALDIDHFKMVNDSLGHEAGDALLRAVASHIAEHVRADDIACRFGGEEFVVVMPEATPEEAAARAEQIREGVAALRVRHGHQMLESPTISIGVATYPEHAEDQESLLRAADKALYRAKDEGRDRIVQAQPGL